MVAVTYGAARIAAASLASKAEPKGKGFFARLFDNVRVRISSWSG